MAKILIIDDEPANLKILQLILLEADQEHDIITSEDALGAVELAENSEPDLILTDIKMPDVDGYELCRLLKSKDHTKDIPLIFVSSLFSADDRMRAFELGAVDFIAKPFDPKDIIERINNHLLISESRHKKSLNVSKVKKNFLILCPEEKQVFYMEALSENKNMLVFVNELVSLLICCVEAPPLAVFLDMNSITSIGSKKMSKLFSMDMDWPVIRSSIDFDGHSKTICTDLGVGGSLDDVTQEILDGAESWKKSKWRRRSYRIKKMLRLRYLVDGQDIWKMANCTNISVGGAFIVSYEDMRMHKQCQIEIHDLSDEVFTLNAKIVWSRFWDSGSALPGFAVKFDEQSINDEFRRHISKLKI